MSRTTVRIAQLRNQNRSVSAIVQDLRAERIADPHLRDLYERNCQALEMVSGIWEEILGAQAEILEAS